MVRIVLFIAICILLLASCASNDDTESKIDSNIFISDLCEHRAEFLNDYIHDRIVLYKDKSSNPFTMLYNVITKGKSGYIKELNSLPTDSSLIKDYIELRNNYISAFTEDEPSMSDVKILDVVNLNKLATDIYIESNYKSGFSVFLSLMGDFVLDGLIILLLFGLFIIGTTSFVGSGMLAFIYTNPITYVITFILSFFIHPFGWITSDLDNYEEIKVEEVVKQNNDEFKNSLILVFDE